MKKQQEQWPIPNFDFIIANKSAYLNGSVLLGAHLGLHRHLLDFRPHVPQMELG